jgi:hypothetical protein
VLSVSRWYLQDQPAETLRLVLLGMEAWEQKGVDDPSQHVMVVLNPKNWLAPEAMATVLFKRTPFSAEQVARAQQEAERLGFILAYTPGTRAGVGGPQSNEDNPVAQAVLSTDRQTFINDYPLDISPPTDDRPFFFALARLGHLLNRNWGNSTVYTKSVESLNVLTSLLGITVAAAGVFVVGPLGVARRRRREAPVRFHSLAYFALLGLGFMLIEIPVVQRMALYLGHPTYALAVVLFSLLICSGLGSLATHHIAPSAAVSTLRRRIPLLLILIILQGYVGPILLEWTQGWPLVLRIVATVGMLAPLGFLMGIPFPLGWKWISQSGVASTPWLWGINGALSVVGSVLAALVSIQFGFRITMVLGLLAYSLAWAMTFQRNPSAQ